MPRVPQYGDAKVRQISQPTPNVVQNVPVPDIVSGVGAVVDAAMDIRKKANETAVTEAEKKALDLDFATFDDPEKGYLVKQGKTAIENYQPTLEAYDGGMAKIRAELKNDEQRDLFDRKVATARRQQARLTAARHMSQQSERYAETEMQGRLENAISAAGRNAEDPTRVGYEIGTARADYAKFLSERKGIKQGDEKFDDAMRDFDTKAHETVIDNLLTRPGGGAKAKGYFDAVKDSIDGARVDAIQGKLAEYIANEKAVSAVDVAFKAVRTGGDPGTAELDMVDGIKDDPKAQAIARAEFRNRVAAFETSQNSQIGKAKQWVLENKAFSYARIPREFRDGLTPTNDVELREWITSKIDAARSAPPSPAQKARAEELFYKLPRTPEEFKKADLMAVYSVFEAAGMESQWRQLTAEQDAMLKGKAGDEWAMASPTLDARLGTLGIKKSDPRAAQAEDYIRRQISAGRERKGSALTRQEVDDVIDQSFLKGEIQRSWLPDTEAYQFEAAYAEGPVVGTVPLEDYQKIANTLRYAGEQVTPERVESIYRQFQAQGQ